MELFENGRTAARSFLRTWDWDAYRERFRLPATDAVPAAA
jgi:hypothetical protein